MVGLGSILYGYHVSHVMRKKVQVSNDQEKALSERNFHSKNRGGKKTKLTITCRYLYLENIWLAE